jgi:threonine dehydratase
LKWQPCHRLADVLEARRRISPHLRRRRSSATRPGRAARARESLVKHENHQPVGAFKVRGGVNLISQLSAEERERGVITASTGNHGQSIAYAARLFGVQATICVPEQANPVKVASMRGLVPSWSSTGATSTMRVSIASSSRASTATATCTPATSRC